MQVVYRMAGNTSIKGRWERSDQQISFRYIGMWSRRFCFIVVFVVLGEFAIQADATLDVIKNVTEEEEARIFADCHNSDYRTYIQCLKRHKRHHGDESFHGDEDSLTMG